MIKLLKVDIKNCVNSIRFKLIFMLMFMLILISFFITCKNNYGLNNISLEPTYSLEIIRGFHGRAILHFLIAFSPLLATVIYSDCFFYENSKRISSIIISKVGKRKYILSKLITIFFITFITLSSILILNEILTYISFPNIGTRLRGLPIYDRRDIFLEDSWLFPILRVNHPWIHNLLCIFNISIFATLTAIISYCFSLIIKSNRLTILIAPYLVITTIDIILAGSKFYKFSILNLRYGVSGSIETILITFFLCISLAYILYRIGIKKEQI